MRHVDKIAITFNKKDTPSTSYILSPYVAPVRIRTPNSVSRSVSVKPGTAEPEEIFTDPQLGPKEPLTWEPGSQEPHMGNWTRGLRYFETGSALIYKHNIELAQH